MREIFTEIFENQPLDPTEAAQRAMRPHLRQRFYKQAHTGDTGDASVAILLDGKPVLTPARRALAAPSHALAGAIAAEWDAQADVIDPARMPLTRLANAVIDAVSETPQPVADEIAKYLGTDLLCYRADAPARLVEKQSQAWDPVLALGARTIRRALRSGARCRVRAATTRSGRCCARGNTGRAVAAWRNVIDHDSDRLRVAGACDHAWCA